MASSIPGMEEVSSAMREEIPDSSSEDSAESTICCCIFSMSSLASISIAERFVKPLIGVGSRPIFWQNASERLCAGSVDTMRTCWGWLGWCIGVYWG